MAEKRMFSRAVVCSDAFLDMPSDAQCLYFQLNLASDDRGFCDCPRRVMRMIGCSDDAMKLLIAKKFVLIPTCNDQVIVIKHWRINNNMRSQRFKETKYTDILAELYYDENNSYSHNPGDGHIPCLACSDADLLADGRPTVNQRSTNGRPSVDRRLPQNRIEENRIEESREEEERLDKDNNKILSICLSESEKTERIAYWRQRIAYFTEKGWSAEGIFPLAEAEGISREELETAT